MRSHALTRTSLDASDEKDELPLEGVDESSAVKLMLRAVMRRSTSGSMRGSMRGLTGASMRASKYSLLESTRRHPFERSLTSMRPSWLRRKVSSKRNARRRAVLRKSCESSGAATR